MLVEDADFFYSEARRTAGLYQRRPDRLSLCLRRICHQQRGQAVGHFDVSTVLLCCTSTVLYDPAIVVGIAQPQKPATLTSSTLEEPFSHNRQDESLDRASPFTSADGRHYRRYRRRLTEKGLQRRGDSRIVGEVR